MSKLRDVVVVRVGEKGAREDEHFHSPEVQIEAARRWAKDRGERLAASPIPEIDVSGRLPLSRPPGLLAAIEMIEAGQADQLVVAYFDRLVRSLKVQLEVIDRVERAGGEIFALDHGKLTNGTAAQRLSTNMLGSVFQYFAEITGEKVTAAQARAVARGVYPHPKIPVGYVRENGVLTVVMNVLSTSWRNELGHFRFHVVQESRPIVRPSERRRCRYPQAARGRGLRSWPVAFGTGPRLEGGLRGPMLVEMAGIDGTGAFQRARTPAQKQQRREAILAAARALALGRGVGNVTLAAIADEVGLAKSNVLSYFGTLDAIYLHLVNEEWRDWVTVAAARLTGATSGPADVADALSLSFAEQPLLCDLLAHAVRYVEHSVSADDVLAQQVTVGPAVDHLVTKIVDALPQLSEPVAIDLMLLTAIVGGGLWLRANPSPGLKSLYKTNPAMPAAFIDFAATLQTLVRTLIEGVIASDEPPQRLIHQRHVTEAAPRRRPRH